MHAEPGAHDAAGDDVGEAWLAGAARRRRHARDAAADPQDLGGGHAFGIGQVLSTTSARRSGME